MKTLSFQCNSSLLLILLFLILLGCKEYSEDTGVIMTIKGATAPFNDEERVDSVPPIPQKSVLVKTRYLYRAVQLAFITPHMGCDRTERLSGPERAGPILYPLLPLQLSGAR